MQDFDPCLVYNVCFPSYYILDWFSHRSDEALLTLHLTREFYNDSTWVGFAICAYFLFDKNQTSVLDILDSENSYNLICHWQTNIGSVKPRHVYCLTKNDLILSQLGVFVWLSYIPCGSFPDWLEHCIRIEVSFATNCPGLKAFKCALRPLYKHSEDEFKKLVMYCMKSSAEHWCLLMRGMIENRNRNRLKRIDEARLGISGSFIKDSQPERRREQVDPMLKDKGKQVLEE